MLGVKNNVPDAGEIGGSEPKRGWAGRAGVIALVLLAVIASGAVVSRVFFSTDTAPRTGGATGAPPPVAPLVLGDASADLSLGTSSIGGIKRGFPQTLPGAVEAATAMVPWGRTAGANLPTSTRRQLLASLGVDRFSGWDELAAKFQRMNGLTADGQPTNGQPGDTFMETCLPQYGAYYVAQATPSEAAPTRVAVMIWEPCVVGTGSPAHIDNLHIAWDWYYEPVSWSSGDWRAATGTPVDPGKAPTPADMLHPNVSVAERARLLGPTAKKGGHWQLYQGYSEAWPTAVLGPEPTGGGQS